jgi:RNA polymerase sigma factor (sigma-70 family)
MDLRIKSLVQPIKDDNRLVIKELYNQLRPQFMAWFTRHYYCRTEDVEDAYQRSFNIFYFNVRDDKITMLDTKANTYLFSIGKNIILKVLNKEPRLTKSTDETLEMDMGTVDIDFDFDETYRKEIILRMLNQIDEICRNVLILSFYKNFAMESIASEMNFKSQSVAKKKKHLCLKKLKDLVDKHKIARDSLV